MGVCLKEGFRPDTSVLSFYLSSIIDSHGFRDHIHLSKQRKSLRESFRIDPLSSDEGFETARAFGKAVEDLFDARGVIGSTSLREE